MSAGFKSTDKKGNLSNPRSQLAQKSNHWCHKWKTCIFCNTAHSAVLAIRMYICSLLYLTWTLNNSFFLALALVYFWSSETCCIFGTGEKEGVWKGVKGLEELESQDLFKCLTCNFLMSNFKIFKAIVLSFPLSITAAQSLDFLPFSASNYFRFRISSHLIWLNPSQIKRTSTVLHFDSTDLIPGPSSWKC